MLRGVAYFITGWLLLATVGGLADVFDLSLMLPATTAIVLTHLAYGSLPGSIGNPPGTAGGLAVAIGLGYLEDLYQGAPQGTLTLAWGVTFLCLRWSASRLHLPGRALQAATAAVAVSLADLATLGVLLLIAVPLQLQVTSLLDALPIVGWHALATFLAAPPLWLALDRMLVVLRLEEPKT